MLEEIQPCPFCGKMPDVRTWDDKEFGINCSEVRCITEFCPIKNIVIPIGKWTMRNKATIKPLAWVQVG